MMTMDSRTALTELLLTCELYNENETFGVDDLPHHIREHYWNAKDKTVPRPIYVTEADVKKIYGVDGVKDALKNLPFLEFEDFGSQIKLTVFDIACKWFVKQKDAEEFVQKNPVLSHYFEQQGLLNASYERAKKANKPKEASRQWIDSLLADVAAEKGSEDMLKLVYILAPEEVEQTLDDLVLTEEQHKKVEKISRALQYRDYLKKIGLTEIGKMLFVGPPGTGKTSTASALSHRLNLPFIEVRLSMITDQYLGETAKNIDRIFYLSKKLSPCILFIDEFDFVAKNRSSDENAALKRAVNTLLKAIDELSLIKDGVLLIAATNHPQLLDHAVWRRFDEIVDFNLPDVEMRKNILDLLTKNIDGELDTQELAELTEGYSGSDLRVVLRDAVLGALLTNRTKLTQQDLLNAINSFDKRITLKTAEPFV
jgi:SpoVK/Ycf46/Vps4 family AAA+-type ATPase